MNKNTPIALLSITLAMLLCIGSFPAYSEGATQEQPPTEPPTEAPTIETDQPTVLPTEEPSIPSTQEPVDPPTETPTDASIDEPLPTSEPHDNHDDEIDKTEATPTHLPDESRANTQEPYQQAPEYHGVIALEAVDKITVELKDGRQMIFRLPVSAFGDYTILELLSLILTPDFEESVGLTIYE